MISYEYTTTPIESATLATANTIREHLKNNERVLWLLTGGSGFMIAIKVLEALSDIKLNNLYITMTDERYGVVGHDAENWQLLLNSGFKAPGAKLYRPLNGKDRTETTEKFKDWLSEQLYHANYKIGLFGIGEDGHTAGIKPNSIAARTQDLATSFTGDDYERITMSLPAISKLDEAIIQVSGDNKFPVLHKLFNEQVSPTIQPAQIFKSIPKATIYSNVKLEG